LAGIEGIAAAAAAYRRRRRILDDWRGRSDLRLIARRPLRIGWLPLRVARLCRRLLVGRLRRRGGNARLGDGRRSAWAGGSTDRCAAAELAQPVLELPVAVLQFLVLAGELTELAFQPLDPQFKIIGLGKGLRRDGERRGEHHGPGNHMKSG
jgi:hypothetical protein